MERPPCLAQQTSCKTQMCMEVDTWKRNSWVKVKEDQNKIMKRIFITAWINMEEEAYINDLVSNVEYLIGEWMKNSTFGKDITIVS